MARQAHRAGRASRGFTLIELMVSLVAGLIVGMAVVALAKTVTNQFYEEVRASAAESSIRMAGDRLRADLSRAGLMSSGNLRRDPRAVKVDPADPARGHPGLQQLVGVRIEPGGSAAQATGILFDPAFPVPPTSPAGLSPALVPDAFSVWGNMTTGDEYFGSVDGPGGCGANSLRIRLNQDDPSLLRITRQPDGALNPQASAALFRIFVPVVGSRFLVRVTDTKGFYHYAPVCGAAVDTAGTATVDIASPDSNPALLTSSNTGGVGGVDGLETISISPLQGVRWYIARRPNASLENAANSALSTAKYDLFRAWIDVDGRCLINTAELVSEFAIDLKLGFTVDDPSVAEANPAKTRVIPMNAIDSDKMPWMSTAMPAPNMGRGTVGPHRIRSVRFRLSTRTALPDRQETLTSPPGYLYRYPVGTGFARVRTVTGEVALVNQARMNY